MTHLLTVERAEASFLRSCQSNFLCLSCRNSHEGSRRYPRGHGSLSPNGGRAAPGNFRLKGICLAVLVSRLRSAAIFAFFVAVQKGTTA